MELHRASGGDRKLALVGLAYGAVSLVVGAACAALGGWVVAVIVWLPGVFFFLLGLVVLLGSLRPFRIAVSETGLVVHSEGHRFAGPWSQVEAIGIERAGTPPMSRPVLVLWVADGVPMRHAASFPPHAPSGHVIAELENLRETRAEIAELLGRYAGDRFRRSAP